MRCEIHIKYGHIDVLNNAIKVWPLCGRRYRQESSSMLLRKCAPVLTLDVLQIAEGQLSVARLTNLAKSGYFSAVGRLSFIQKSTYPVSCFCASRSFSCNWIHPKYPPPLQLAGSRHLVDQQCEAY